MNLWIETEASFSKLSKSSLKIMIKLGPPYLQLLKCHELPCPEPEAAIVTRGSWLMEEDARSL